MDIEKITKRAKKQLLAMKSYPPTFFIEFKDGHIGMVMLTSLEGTTPEKKDVNEKSSQSNLPAMFLAGVASVRGSDRLASTLFRRKGR